MARITAVLLAAAVASISVATSPPRWWRVLRYSTFSSSDTLNPRLAPNNGWSICRDDAGNLHVTWTEEDGTEVNRVYYRKSTDDGRNWGPRERMSHPTAYWAGDAVIATVGSNPVYVGVAWNDSMADTSHIKYRQSEDGAQ